MLKEHVLEEHSMIMFQMLCQDTYERGGWGGRDEKRVERTERKRGDGERARDEGEVREYNI